MIFDILIGAVIVMSMVFGFRRGLIYTCIQTFGWFAALLCGFAFSPRLNAFLSENTDLYDSLHASVSDRFAESAAQQTAVLEGLPRIIYETASEAADGVARTFASQLSLALFSILCFVLVVLAVKLALWLISRLLSKKHAGGFTGLFDGGLGIAMGFVRGIVLAFIVLALVLPVMGIASPETCEALRLSLENAAFAKTLYDNNLLLLIIRDLF